MAHLCFLAIRGSLATPPRAQLPLFSVVSFTRARMTLRVSAPALCGVL